MATLDGSPSLFSGQQWTDWAESVLPDHESGNKMKSSPLTLTPILFLQLCLLTSCRFGHVCITGKPVHKCISLQVSGSRLFGDVFQKLHRKILLRKTQTVTV